MQKVLVIAYYWPPAGGPGVQRWLKFVKYLGDFGVEPVVYVPENPHYPIQDASLLGEIPKNITIYTHPISEPYRFAGFLSSKKTKRISSGIIHTKNQSLLEKLLLWIRGNFFIPDARKNWVKPSIAYLSKVIEKEKIQTVITTGPPHSVHLIGHGLKQKYNLKWLADFRDPWTSIGYHKKLKLTKAAKKKHKHLEHLVLNSADKVIVTSANTQKEFQSITKKPIEVITNGYDGTDNVSESLDEKFTISHIGSLLSGRNPINLWRVLGELIQENQRFKNAFELQLIGVVSKDVLDVIHTYGLQSHTKTLGYLSHYDVLKRQQESQILLLVEIDSEETIGILPGKLFEYMAAKRPILAVGPKDWEAGTLISETESGVAFDYESNSRLKDVILEWFHGYEQGNLKVTSMNVEKYSRKELTKQLAKHL